LQNTPRC